MPIRVVLEHGTKGKRAVVFALDWPGWSRGARSPEQALATHEAYRERYRPVAVLAGMGDEFDAAGPARIVEDRIGSGSTDFWGISFTPSSFEQEPMDAEELERKIILLRACWAFFDACVGPGNETIGTTMLEVGAAFGMHAELLRLIRWMQESRMGLYVHEGAADDLVLLRVDPSPDPLAVDDDAVAGEAEPGIVHLPGDRDFAGAGLEPQRLRLDRLDDLIVDADDRRRIRRYLEEQVEGRAAGKQDGGQRADDRQYLRFHFSSEPSC